MSEISRIRIWVMLIVLVLLAGFSIVLYILPRNIARPVLYRPMTGTSTLSGASTTISIEFAVTPHEQQRGLSGRLSIAPDHGMLFVFPRPDKYPFWMPDMHFPIDIIWIDAGKHIVDVAANVSPDSYPQLFEPKAQAQYVLEVNAGFAKEWGWTEGTELKW